MDAETPDELHELRARAYGPSADIDEDPAALQRLHELEARSSASMPPEPADDVVAVTVSAPETVRADPESASTLVEPEPTAVPVTPPASPPKMRRRTKILWPLSIVAASALTASATYALTSIAPVSVSSGAEQIAALEPTATLDIPTGWFGGGPSSLTFEFFGLTLFQTSGGYTGMGTECFAVIATDDLPKEDADTNGWSTNGMTYSGCRVGAFPATVEVLVDTRAPKALSDQFPVGTALQFVLDGDRIGVFLDPS